MSTYQAMEVESTSVSNFFLDLSTVSINNTNTSQPVRNEELVWIEIAVLGTFFTLAIINNLCVLFVLLCRSKTIRRMQMFILHLSIADLTVAFFNILPQFIWDLTFRFMGGDAMCRFVKYAQMFSLYLSTYILIMTAIDRYQAICYPLSHQTWTPYMVHCKIFTAYAIATIFSIPQAILFQLQEVKEGSGIYDCWVHFEPAWLVEAYTWYVFCALYLIPIIILIFTYGSICYTIWTKHHQAKEKKQKRNFHYSKSRKKEVFLRTHSVRGFSKAKLNSVKLTFAVIVTYVICWTPFFLFHIWWLFDETVIGHEGVVIVLLLAFLNSCTNPWIYLIFNRNYLYNFFSCKKLCHNKNEAAANNTEMEQLSLTNSNSSRRPSGNTVRDNNSPLHRTSDQFTYTNKTTI